MILCYTCEISRIQKKVSEMVHMFSRPMGYKINIQNSVVFLCTNNKHGENKVMETIPFTNPQKKLPINITKEMKDTYIKALNLKKSTKTVEHGKTSHSHEMANIIVCKNHSSKSH